MSFTDAPASVISTLFIRMNLFQRHYITNYSFRRDVGVYTTRRNLQDRYKSARPTEGEHPFLRL